MRKILGLSLAVALFASPAGAIPSNSQAYTKGVFGPAFNWPLIGLHSALTPDGRVLSYGTDQNGWQTGLIVYDVWNPGVGTGTNSHLTLPNGTGADLFCSAQTILTTGQLLLTGGDAPTPTGSGEDQTHARKYSTRRTTLSGPTGECNMPVGTRPFWLTETATPPSWGVVSP